ncbi:MAG: hypothetical protein SFY67_05125 [Candidatus Melainabacteria bacterium]|nr:hypothetical protein [Candidatus Melainabacteria bacterium]
MTFTEEELAEFDKASMTSSVSNFTQEDLDSFDNYNSDLQIQPKEAESISKFGKYLQQKYQLGNAAIRNGALGRKVMDGTIDYEDAQKMIEADDETRFNQQNVEDYEKSSNLFYIPQIMGATLGTVPFMIEGLKGAAAGAATGATVGTFMGLPGPMAAFGASLGTAHVTSEIAAGNSYLTMRAKGIPHDTAKLFSTLDGAVQGTIEAAQLGQTGKLVGTAAQNASKPLREAATRHFQNFFKYMGEQLLEEEAQTLSELQFRGMAALASGRPDAAPTMQERADEYWNTFKESSKAFLGLYVGGKVTGYGAGKAAKLLKLQMEETNRRIDKKISEEKQAAAEAALINPPVEISQEVKAELFKGEVKESFSTKSTQAGRVDLLRSQLKELQGKSDGDSKLLRNQLKEELAVAKLDKANEALDIAISENSTPEQRLNLESKVMDARIHYRRMVLDTYRTELQAKAEFLQEELGALGKVIAIRQRAYELKALIKELRSAKDEESIAERTALQTELDALAVESTNFSGLANELSKKERQLDLIEEDLRALDSLSVSMNNRHIAENAHGLDTIITRLKSNKVKALLNRVIKDMTSVARESRNMALKETRLVQSLLAELIDASNLHNKEKFVKQIRKVVSLEELQKALPELDMRIQQAIDAEELRASQARLKKALSVKTMRDGKSIFGTETDAVFGDERVQKVFDLYETFIKDELSTESKGLAQKTIDSFDSALAANEDVKDLDLPSFIAQQVIGLKNKTSVELNNLSSTIYSLVKSGLDKALAERVRRKEELARIAELAEQAFQGEADKKHQVPTDITQADPSIINSILGAKHAASNMNALLSSWEGKLAWAAQHSKLAEQLINALDVHTPVQEVITNTRKSSEKLNDFLAAAMPDKKFASALKKILDGAKSERLPGYKQIDGTWRESITLSPNQAVRLWLQLQDRALDEARREGNKYSLRGEVQGLSTQEMLEEYFTREDRKHYLQLGKALQNFYRENFARVNEATIDEFGRELERNEFYSGFAAHERDNEFDLHKDWQASLSMRANPRKPGPTYDRVRSRSPLKPVDAFVDAYHQIQVFEHWNVWRSAAKPIAAALLTTRAKNILTQKYGKHFYDALVTHFNDLVGGTRIQNTQWNSFINKLLTRFADVMLLARPVQFFKQLTGVSLVLTKVNEAQLIAGYTDFMMHPLESWKTLSESDSFKNRFGDFMAQQIGALVKDSEPLKALKRMKLRDFLSAFIRYGDQVVYVMGGHVIYREAIKSGATHEAALLEAGRFANRTSGSGTVDQLSNLARQPLGRMFTLLTQQPTRMLEQQIIEWNRAVNFPTTKNIQQAIRTTLYAHTAEFLFSLAGFIWLSIFDGDDDDKTEQRAIEVMLSLLGPMRSAAVTGPVINNAGKLGLNTFFEADLRIYQWNIAAADMIHNTGKFISAVLNAMAKGDADAEDWAKIFDYYVKGPNILLPSKIGGGLPLTEVSAGVKDLAEE